jgi:invasion protein IalB
VIYETINSRISRLLLFTSLLLNLSLLSNVALAETENNKETTTDKKTESVTDKKTTSKQYNDWILQCGGEGLKEDQCYITQNISIQKSGTRSVRVVASYQGPENKPLMIFILPLGILLPAGMTFNIDDGEKNKLPIRICLPGGCKVRMILNKKLIGALKKGNQATVTFVGGKTRKQIIVEISLNGFTKAMSAL